MWSYWIGDDITKNAVNDIQLPTTRLESRIGGWRILELGKIG
jgi:hypothetical protein